MPASTTTSTTTMVPGGDVDLAVSILTILTTLCQASKPALVPAKGLESPECRKAQIDLLNLVTMKETPWIIRGSSSSAHTSLEKGLLDFIKRSDMNQRDFGMSRGRPLIYDGVNWPAFFKGIQGLFAVARDLKDPLNFAQKIKDYLSRESEVSSDKLRVFLDFHQIEAITQVLNAVEKAELRATYIIAALILFSVLTTCIWLVLNIRSYCDQKRARKALKASRQASTMLREMQNARRNQLAGIEAHALM